MSDELWKQAMKKLKIDKNKFNREDFDKIVEFMSNYKKEIPHGIEAQIAIDVGIYKKYDAIAMWVGNGGLIDFEPEFITELVKMFGIEE